MPISLTHAAQSALPDGPDTDLIQPSDWNAEHSAVMSADRLLGRVISFPVTGEAAEIALAPYLTMSGGTLRFADTSALEEITLDTPLSIADGGHGGTTPQEALRNLELELVGGIFHFPMSTAPAGFLKANGAAVSRTTYADLFAKIGTIYGAGNGSTTFNLPDMRGVFIRGKDDGRGLDPGRAVGTLQIHQIQSHAHSFSGTTSTNGWHEHTTWLQSGRAGDSGASIEFMGCTNRNDFGALLTAAAGDHTHFWSGSTANAGAGTESRPRNFALLACVKY